ncbi:hypothetical protein EDB19DRAFT_1831780 [Suillus lakei]|nr:hypothetical protein EDB19DRAFT_1831780 [Suillus lakei]
MSPKYLLDIGMAESDGEGHEFFVNNQLIKVWAGLDGFTLIRRCLSSKPSFLPSSNLGRAPDDYGLIIVTPLAKLFASADRGTRIVLLDSLPDFTEKLDKETVVNKIWPNLQTGFTDTVTVIREAIVRAIVLLSPKLSDRILNNDRLHTEASIRTNMCILIGRLGISLEYNTKRKVLVPTFSMALRDSLSTLVWRVLWRSWQPRSALRWRAWLAKSFQLLLVHDQAFKAVKLFVKRLEAHAATMPETASTEEGGEDLPARLRGAFTQAGLGRLYHPSVKRCTAQLAPADMQMTISITIDGSPLAPNLNGHAGPLPLSSASPFVNPSRSKGLQLSGNKAPTSTLTAQLTNEAGQGSNRLWNDNLIDIHADEGDWIFVYRRIREGSTHSGIKAREYNGWSRIQPIALLMNGVQWHHHLNLQVIHLIHGGHHIPPRSHARSPHNLADPLHLPLSHQHFHPLQAHESTPVSSPRPLPNAADNALSTSMAGMSKEEKAAEMARRKEERRLGIEKLKEQKKNAAAAGKDLLFTTKQDLKLVR